MYLLNLVNQTNISIIPNYHIFEDKDFLTIDKQTIFKSFSEENDSMRRLYLCEMSFNLKSS